MQKSVQKSIDDSQNKMIEQLRKNQTEIVKAFINQLDYSNIEFPVDVKQYNKIENQTISKLMSSDMKKNNHSPIYVSKEKFDNCMNLLLITDGKNKHYVLIKDFNKFMYNQTNYKERKHFCMYCLQCFSKVIIYKQQFLQSDWLRTCQLIPNQ